MDWTCEICGKDTSRIDYDYLDGRNHLACVLGVWGGDNAMKKNKSMKIKGWEKINGYTYKGLCIVNPIHNADETKYFADVINLNLPQKPKWELNVLTPKHKFKKDNAFDVILWDENNLTSRITATKSMISSVSDFRTLVEKLIDEVLKLRLTSAPTYNSHSLNGAYNKPINPNLYTTVNAVSGQSGILNTINTTGTNIVVSGTSGGQISQYNLIDTIKELQKQIDDLNLKLNTPTNPF